jgi:tetratricopeptide (TPR) repeat protein
LNEEAIMGIRATTVRRANVIALMLGLCLATAGPALADGGGGGGGGNNTNCKPGEVYDEGRWRCVQRQAGVLPDKDLAEYAFGLAKVGRYQEALEVLDLLQDPNTAVALNYRGYITRKMGHVDEGIAYYLRSVALDPNYAQVREYLGEAYLIKGDMASAQAQLQAIRQICGTTTCEAYEHLAVAIADPADI